MKGNKKIDIKSILKMENRDYGELNDMANSIIDESVEELFKKHAYGTKTEQLNAFNALVKRFPEYKTFCYPETFLRDNELYICKENCDFVRRSAFYDLVNNYEEIRDYCGVELQDINTELPFIEFDKETMEQLSKDEIEALKEQHCNFIDYKNRLKVEIASRKQDEENEYHFGDLINDLNKKYFNNND